MPPSVRATLDSIRIEPINGSRDLRRFIHLPWSVYADDPVWIPPLLIERREQFSRRNPYFAHARCRFWLAYRGTRPVGRISAQIDELHEARHRDATGFFGLLEAEDEAETFHALLSTAESWLRNQGMLRIRGPFNLSINQECGLLVKGYDTPPMIMMGHARPYYADRIRAEGYEGSKDLLAYRVATDFTPPALMQAAVNKAAGCVRIRPLRRSSMSEELHILKEIYEDAWSANWGFIPFTEEEFRHLGYSLRLLVEDECVQIAEVDGAPAGMIVALPNLNEAIGDLRGRLLPFGWLKLLWRLKVKRPTTARVVLMGVRKYFQRSALGTALAFMLIDAVRGYGIRRGVREVELSWILEDNMPMRNMLAMIGGIPYKCYRIYEKALR
ncbi:MAG: N-acetyltransferase [candidate division NC10 bacterium]|nr:N-acetyltransferase [candidate division NC10 bacterium]MDE2322415.1 N-acetyltransferase [candidate division NC10 bacterium]